MKKKVAIVFAVIAGLLIVLILFGGKKDKKEVLVKTEVKYGYFLITVSVSGELEAENSTKILGPQLNKIHIWNASIERIIPEGTLVDSGDFVAKIEASDLADKQNEAQLSFEMAETQYSNTVLDTTLELRQLRDKLMNLKFEYEEAEIRLEQSQFEPPATIRQEEINKEKAQRAYKQAVEAYKVKVQQGISTMREASINKNKALSKLDRIFDLQHQLMVFAPKSGMVIYTKDRHGNKKREGSRISTWNPVVAELPDLSKMISKTYVNEIDISKIKVGQKVTIGIDAFPQLQFTGTVTQIANIGEQLKNSDAKVFEVIIKISEKDSTLRPAMTTSNEIVINKYDSVLFAPIESVFGNDTINWVYKSNGRSTQKQQVIVGESNENDIIIYEGVSKGDILLMTVPKNDENFEIILL